MDVTRKCMEILTEHQMFENSEHRSRFSELVNCYSGYPFFDSGLCKCMYLAAWDDAHFFVMLDILNDMTIGKSQNADPMLDNEVKLEETWQGDEKYVLQLCACFLNHNSFRMPEEISKEGEYIIRRGIEAALLIDQVFEEEV